MVEWATLIKAAQLIDSWSNGDKIPLNKWICKDDNKYIGIDNSDGNCWVEEFDTALECIKWLTDYEDADQRAEKAKAVYMLKCNPRAQELLDAVRKAFSTNIIRESEEEQ